MWVCVCVWVRKFIFVTFMKFKFEFIRSVVNSERVSECVSERESVRERARERQETMTVTKR